ncbi:MAG: hypothetical protein LUE26_07355 [Alistipes sp.]|nr:hypothetical protein [Alistipes sp.]
MEIKINMPRTRVAAMDPAGGVGDAYNNDLSKAAPSSGEPTIDGKTIQADGTGY